MEIDLSRVRIVLCRTSHPGNIGAAARAMKTMGITDLRLVAPERFPAPEATWMATHASDVLEKAVCHEKLHEAIHDCAVAFALSARPREWSPHVVDVRTAAKTVAGVEDKVAFVFGSESAGLTNDEMFACQYLVHIPANPGFSSLNLAQAVQVVAYETWIAAGGIAPRFRAEKLATVDDLEGLYSYLLDAAAESRFYDPGAGSKLPERLRRLFSRVPEMTREEVNILRGLVKALRTKGE
jgi:tRNA/rRNA methyltransferase